MILQVISYCSVVQVPTVSFEYAQRLFSYALNNRNRKWTFLVKLLSIRSCFLLSCQIYYDWLLSVFRINEKKKNMSLPWDELVITNGIFKHRV